MRELYSIVSGPLAWVAWGVFIAGSIYRLVSMRRLARSKDVSSLAYMDARFGLRSICAWLTPYLALGWRQNPGVCFVTFVFHVCLIVVALFAPAHVALWEYSFGIRLPSLPEGLTDALTILVVSACVYFAVRRLFLPMLRFVSRPMDWAVLLMVAAPFVTGLMARHHIGDYAVMSVLHVLSGDVMLMAIPFTRLSHALFAPFTRAYMGSEFGAVRHCIDW